LFFDSGKQFGESVLKPPIDNRIQVQVQTLLVVQFGIAMFTGSAAILTTQNAQVVKIATANPVKALQTEREELRINYQNCWVIQSMYR